MVHGGHVNLPRAESPTFQEAVDNLGQWQVGVTPEGMAVCRDEDGQRLALSFAPWFYNILKQAACPIPPLTDERAAALAPMKWGPHHFWQDARLQIFELPDGVDERYMGAEGVAAKLATMVANRFVFVPTLTTDGVKGMMTLNNAISVSVGGRVTRMTEENACESGTFEQSFTLVQDLVSTNWRIKTTNLKFMWLMGQATNDPDDVQDQFPFPHTTPCADLPLGLPPS